jgi:hypothetical protein
MKRLLLTTLTLLVCGLAVFGQAPDDIVAVKVIFSSDAIKAGQTVPVTIELAVRPPYHINRPKLI